MATALDAGLRYWEDPQRVFRTPTEGHDSPHVEPPGLPTPKAGPTSPQEFMQQGAASSSRLAAGCTEFHRIDSGQRSEQYVGGYRQVPREDANLGEPNLLEGRTGARTERDVRDRIREDDGRPSHPESHHFAGSAQKDERI